MDMALYILIALLMFGILIALHELGHFITAKLLGVRVNEFAIGMGPCLWSKVKGRPSTPSGPSPSAATVPWRGRTRTPTTRGPLGTSPPGRSSSSWWRARS